ncbi:hypothetical protein IQ251_14490 [Saccharopolyspora sp. HNM0983]|uniref:Uncharacterized protein n=1 Tax=Saccharopolyspora montiporae TaxID=2781240 RepID=A0A929BCQ6_9PSEU|nr:hypothetical protein [Saccharopolyspora sp. HNM0983]MBE9375658.1 hypothetical protein [Saccharopolyspora sp. HNM0983]
MAGETQLSLEFGVPSGWNPARPEAVGATGAAFVALHAASEGPGFTTNITMDELQRAESTLAEVADESLDNLHRASRQVSLSNRSEFGADEAPGLTQIIRVTAEVDGEDLDLVQCQVYLQLQDARDPRQRAIVRVVLTAREEDFDAVLPDFQEFVGTVRVKEASAG